MRTKGRIRDCLEKHPTQTKIDGYPSLHTALRPVVYGLERLDSYHHRGFDDGTNVGDLLDRAAHGCFFGFM